ncbi:MAG: glycosyltransferase [Fimbriimonadaceae bacterium]|nr:glycosyltransferase [Fimbriimonadaceae bacterium]
MLTAPSIDRRPRVPGDPVVSVVIPAWRPWRLAEVVGSVRAQTLAGWELIVVDDGSPEPVVVDGDDLVLVRQANSGPGAARNLGVELARAPLVAFLDSDDLWAPGKLAAQARLHQGAPEVVLSATNARYLTAAGSELGRAGERYGLAGPQIPYGRLFHENCLVTSAVMVQREAFRRTRGFDTVRRGAEDYAAWLRIGRLGEIGYLDEPLVDYLVSDSGLTGAGARAGDWHTNELAVYAEILAEYPELRRAPFVAGALARAEFDAGWGHLSRREWAAARGAFARALWQRPQRLKTWLNLARATLHLAPGGGR